jgi:hypothetical protein
LCTNVIFRLREEYRLRVFHNMVLRRIFGLEGGSGRRLEKIPY